MDDIIQFKRLGKSGRFGNQLFQYIFARAYAEKYNAVLEIPHWIGEKIFKNVSHRKPTCKLSETRLDQVPWGQVNIDLYGYFQKKQFTDIVSESKVRDWLQFKDKWIKRFKKKEKYSIVAHLRRGDYVVKYSHHFCIVTKESYVRACKKYALPQDKVTWLSEETQKHISELSNKLQFLPDLFSTINADVLLRANSTFSFWGGFFSKGKVYSPLVENRVGPCDVDFIEGNSAKIVSAGSPLYFGIDEDRI